MSNKTSSNESRSSCDVIVELLSGYGAINVRVNPARHEIYSSCPIHGGTNPQALNVNYQKLVYICHTKCQAGGSIAQLISLVEHCDIAAAKKKLEGLLGRKIPNKYHSQQHPLVGFGDGEEFTANPQIVHDLRVAYREHCMSINTYRDFNPYTLKFFQIAMGKPYGIFRDRVVIPVFNCVGDPVMFKLRDISGKAHSKYVTVPSGVSKSRILFNYSNIDDSSYIVLVEGEFKVMKMFEYGIQAVASMGKSISFIQAQLLSSFDHILCFRDGDEGGDDMATRFLTMMNSVGYRGVTTIIDTPYGMDPDEFSLKEVKELLGF